MNRPKRTADFSFHEREVIRDRARYQSKQELAAVFGTSTRVISNIIRYA